MRTFFAMVRKEVQVHSRHRGALWSRLLVGPLVSVGTVTVIYAGLFRNHGELRIGEVGNDNFLAFTLLGFLGHTALNSGYYALSSKFIAEWVGGTLPLLWWSPRSRISLIASLYSVELAKFVVVGLVTLAVLLSISSQPLPPPAGVLSALVLFHSMGIALGLLRTLCFLNNEGKADLLDQLFLLFTFSACFYFPVSLLPEYVNALVEFNPAFHGANLMRASQPSLKDFGFSVLGSVALWAALVVLWGRYRFKILERSLA
ncbi:MAG: ABC transporter permease [Bdellovibrionales bacterium]|nr:ABC transporter permease [Bdellovibrionales bacterium]